MSGLLDLYRLEWLDLYVGVPAFFTVAVWLAIWIDIRITTISGKRYPENEGGPQSVGIR